MKRHFGPCWPVFTKCLNSSKANSDIGAWEKGPIVGYQRSRVFELDAQYEFINSEIYSDDGRNGYHRNVAYPFNGFPLLVKQKSSGDYLLLDKSGERKAWLQPNLKGAAPNQGGFYLGSKEVDEKLYRSTRFILWMNPAILSS